MMMTSNTTQGTSTATATATNFTQAATPTFSTGGPSTSGTITSSIDKFMIFTTTGINHTFTVPAGGLNCDILMIGSGGSSWNGGSGAGACIVAINQTLPAGSCVVVVGAQVGGSQMINGNDSFITVDGAVRYLAKGGGCVNGNYNSSGYNGGCGGGASPSFNGSTLSGGAAVSTNVVNGLVENTPPRITSTYAVMGNAGGGANAVTDGSCAGGGGIGEVGGAAGGKGGDGAYQVTLSGAATPINFRNYFANGSTSFGVQDGTTGNYYIGGGGGGLGAGGPNGISSAGRSGGLGGGGGNNGTIGVANTGAGGYWGNASGSGIIIIRYRSSSTTTTYTHTPTSTTTLTTTLGTPSIELVRGTQGDSNTDYKIGNYNGDFIVKSSISSIDTDRFNITTAGNIGIGITNPAVKLQVVGGDFACSGDISAYYSDERLKTRLSNIKDPLEIIGKLNGFYYIPNDLARFYGITNMAQEIGLSAQEVNKVLPELVKIAPFDLSRDEDNNKVSKSGENYLTLSYDRLAPVFVEAIKELRCSNDDLNEKYNRLLERFVNDEKL